LFLFLHVSPPLPILSLVPPKVSDGTVLLLNSIFRPVFSSLFPPSLQSPVFFLGPKTDIGHVFLANFFQD